MCRRSTNFNAENDIRVVSPSVDCDKAEGAVVGTAFGEGDGVAFEKVKGVACEKAEVKCNDELPRKLIAVAKSSAHELALQPRSNSAGVQEEQHEHGDGNSVVHAKSSVHKMMLQPRAKSAGVQEEQHEHGVGTCVVSSRVDREKADVLEEEQVHGRSGMSAEEAVQWFLFGKGDHDNDVSYNHHHTSNTGHSIKVHKNHAKASFHKNASICTMSTTQPSLNRTLVSHTIASCIPSPTLTSTSATSFGHAAQLNSSAFALPCTKHQTLPTANSSLSADEAVQ